MVTVTAAAAVDNNCKVCSKCAEGAHTGPGWPEVVSGGDLSYVTQEGCPGVREVGGRKLQRIPAKTQKTLSV